MRKALSVMAVILVLLPVTASAVREQDLPEALDSVILPYFNDRLKPGDFAGVDGISIHYAGRDLADARGALVILPGRTEASIKYAELIYDLRRVGLSIYVMDHRGQGFSARILDDPQKGHVKRFAHYVKDLETFIDRIIERKMPSRIFLLAHSMGGAVAILYAESHPNNIAQLILSAPMLEINTSPYPSWVASAITNFLAIVGMGDRYVLGGGPYDPQKPFEGNKLTHSRNRFEMNRRLISRYPEIALGAPTNRWLVEALRASERACKAKLVPPVLLLQAGADRVVKPGGQDEMCRRALSCTKVVLAGSNHEILMEKDDIRNKALSRIFEFLKPRRPQK